MPEVKSWNIYSARTAVLGATETDSQVTDPVTYAEKIVAERLDIDTAAERIVDDIDAGLISYELGVRAAQLIGI